MQKQASASERFDFSSCRFSTGFAAAKMDANIGAGARQCDCRGPANAGAAPRDQRRSTSKRKIRHAGYSEDSRSKCNNPRHQPEAQAKDAPRLRLRFRLVLHWQARSIMRFSPAAHAVRKQLLLLQVPVGIERQVL